jgi:DNA-binding transcriptional ArsR family regulator
MSSIFPLRETVTPDREREPRLVDLDEETADEVFEALSSQTTRKIFLELHHSPQTTSDLAEATDTSVQNVQYHLEKLEDADLVEVVDTWYSERGTEMNVYAPEDESLVLFAGRDKQSTLRSLLNRVAGVLGVLVPGSVLTALGAHRLTGSTGGDNGDAPATDTANGGAYNATATNREADGSLSNGDASVSPDGTDTADEPTITDEGGADLATEDSVDSIEVEYAVDETGGLEAEQAELVVDNETLGTANLTGNETVTTENGTSTTTFDVTDLGVAYAPDNSTPEDAAQTANQSSDLTTAANDTTGNLTDTTNEMMNNSTEAAEAAAGIDPALAAGLGVLVGGLLVLGALTAWYGNW